jgi:predicted butyrate kinase (DUF1464 family)
MPRVAGVDPGTVSFDLCVLQDGRSVVERVFESGMLADDPAPLLDELRRHGPCDLVYGPSGYGLPLVRAADVDEAALSQMVLVRADERGGHAGIGGMRSLLRALAHSGLPVVFGPGVIHLPSVPRHRKYNRIDLGTADKLCATAWAIADQCDRLAVAPRDTSLVLLELGGAFTAAVGVAAGQIVDGAGGSSGSIGARAPGALDGELAYLLAPRLGKRALFSGGALHCAGSGQCDLEAAWRSPAHADDRAALLEGAVKAVRALLTSVPDPREVVASGRLARIPELVQALSRMLGGVAPLTVPAEGGASAAARGAALLADGLAGGRYEPIVRALRLTEARGTVLDHLRVLGADAIELA